MKRSFDLHVDRGEWNRRIGMTGHLLLLLLAFLLWLPATIDAALSGLHLRSLPAGSPPRPSRMVAADRGQPVPYLVDLERLPRGIGEGEALVAVENAFSAWTTATGLLFVRMGTAPFERPASDFNDSHGIIRIQCHDKYGAIGEETALGIGGSGSESGGFAEGGYGGRVHDEEFHRIIRGFVIVNHRHPGVETLSTFEEVVCHEIGHILGFTHSSDDYPEPDTYLREAIMYARIHGDGRGATLTDYDFAVAAKSYPLMNPPPGAFPAFVDAVAVAGGDNGGELAANRIRLAETDTNALAVTLFSTTAQYGSFALDGPVLIYQSHVDSDYASLDPDVGEFYDEAVYRIESPEHASAFERVRIVSLSLDTQPEGGEDGLPDRWMVTHFGQEVPEAGRSNPTDDADGDGCDNMTEFLQQTDPNDAESLTALTFENAVSMVAEVDRHVLLAVNCRHSVARPLWVPFAMGGSAASGGVDYLLRYPGGMNSLFFSPGSSQAVFWLDIVADEIVETDETVTIQLADSETCLLGTRREHTLTISGEIEPPVYDFAQPSFSVRESNGSDATAEVTVYRSGNTALESQVDLVLTPDPDSPATPGVDCVDGTITIVFERGETSGTVALSVKDDLMDEPDEKLVLSFLAFAPFGRPGDSQSTAALVIEDDDEMPMLSLADTAVNEAAGLLRFEAHLSEPSGFPIVVRYGTEDGTATAPSDYTSVDGELIIPRGESQGIIEVTMQNDALDEDDETLHTRLSDAVGATLADDRATGIIFDNDLTPRLRISSAMGDENAESLRFLILLSAASGREISMTYVTEDISAREGEDYVAQSGILTWLPGVTSQIVEIEVLQDYDEEGTETFQLRLTDPEHVILDGEQATGTIADAYPVPRVSFDDHERLAMETEGVVRFGVRLSIAPDKPLIMPYRLHDETATAGLDYEKEPNLEVHFDPGQTHASVAIPILDDGIDEVDETFTVDMRAHAFGEPGATISATGVILDDDPLPVLGLAAETAVESAGFIAMSVTISPASGREIRLKYATADGTAVDRADYEAVLGEVVLPPEVTETSWTVPLLDDGIPERDESIQFLITDWENVRFNGEPVAMVVNDDDPVEPTRLDMSQNGRIVLKWQGLQGLLYRIERSRDLQAWLPLADSDTQRASGNIEALELIPLPIGAKGFYRVIEVGNED